MTYSDVFPSLPDEARIWIYTAAAPLSAEQQEALLGALRPFLGRWASHARPVRGGAQVLENRFLVIAAVLDSGDISGCGIDASVHAVEEAGHQLGIAWLSPLQVFYRDATGQVQTLGRAAFRQLVQAGEVTAATPVFDVSITTLEALRSGGFEKPAGDAWHARVFRIPQPAA